MYIAEYESFGRYCITTVQTKIAARKWWYSVTNGKMQPNTTIQNTNYGVSNKRRSGVFEKHVENMRFVVLVAVLKIGDYQSVQLL
jgi:hypothetical protein